jgi:XTP/dITP diphosphohydrolase
MVTFVTTNAGKVREARDYLGESVDQRAFDYPEVQADDLETVAAEGARAAYGELGEPLFVDDSGLTIDAFDGFPGPYSAFVDDTLGIERVWRLVEPEDDHGATFRTVIAYCDGEPFEASPDPVDSGRRGQDQAAGERDAATTDAQVDERGDIPVKLFAGTVPGTIVAPRGDGGFGYDPIFEYDGRTFAELDPDEKNAVSHRGRALARFGDWFAEADR